MPCTSLCGTCLQLHNVQLGCDLHMSHTIWDEAKLPLLQKFAPKKPQRRRQGDPAAAAVFDPASEESKAKLDELIRAVGTGAAWLWHSGAMH